MTNLFSCPICIDLLVFPMILQCGHTFCNSCLFEWTKLHLECPTCRNKIITNPTRNILLQQHLEQSECKEYLKRILQPQMEFNLQFNPLIVDLEDNVNRCPFCSWEVTLEDQNLQEWYL